MSRDVLEHAFGAVFTSDLANEDIRVLWHAGEPLTVGMEFYSEAVQLEREHNARGLRISNHVQTNATLVTDKWARFFADNKFQIGVSIDGPQRIHDAHRPRWSGSGTHAAAMRGLEALRRHDIFPGALCVLTRDSLMHPDEIFDFFYTNGFDSIGFVVEEMTNAHLKSSLISQEPSRITDEYASFLGHFFDLWWPHRTEMKVRDFYEMGEFFTGLKEADDYDPAILEAQPFAILTIQRDGNVSPYSPEFAGSFSREFNNFVIGNVLEISDVDELRQSPIWNSLNARVTQSKALCRSSCGFFGVCGGGYFAVKQSENGTLLSTETTTCRLHRQVASEVLLDKLSALRAS